MSQNGARVPRVLAIDAGGTMTDTFIVDGRGSFVVGKAQTTPEDESIGFMASARDALGQWSSTPDEGFPAIVSGIYSGTAMLNRLLQRQGLRVGCIVNAGHEDYLRLERGIQTHLGLSYSDRLHVATHFHNQPLVPRALMKGVRGRVDVFGDEVLPLREQDACDAAAELLDEGVQGIVVSLLFSYRNPAHEARVAEIVEREKARRGIDGAVPVFLSSELYPMRRDLPRLNSTVIEAYAAEPSRATLKTVRDVTKAARRPVRAARDGRARRHGLDRGEGARANARLRPGRRRRRRAGARPADGPAQRPVHGHRRHLLRHRADHRRALRDHADARHRALRLEHPARAHRLDRRRHRVVRAREPQLQPPRARARLGGLADRRVLGAGRSRHRVGHRSEPGARSPEPRVLPRRRGRAGRRARARGGRAARSRRRSAWGSSRRRPASSSCSSRRSRTRPSGGSSARATRPPTTRCCATAAAARCTSPATPTASPTARCSCPRGPPGSRHSAARAPTSTTATTRPSTCRCCRASARPNGRASGR